MDLDQREQFFTQLQNFADKHSLKLESNFYDAEKKGFLVALYGDGFHITSVSRKKAPREISIGFYNEASPPTSDATFDKLAVDLKSHLKELPSMVIREKLKRLRIMIDENERQEHFAELFTQLREFADQHSLEFIIISYDTDLRTFLVELDGDGFQITSEAVRNPPGEINIDFYIHYDGNGDPTSTSQETVAELFDDLKRFFGKRPNVTITEEK